MEKRVPRKQNYKRSKWQKLYKSNIKLMTTFANLRQRTKNWFLTYPHCSLENDDIQARLLRKFQEVGINVLFMITSKEFHEDGSPHHHVFIHLDQTFTLRRTNMNFFDLLKDDTEITLETDPNLAFYHCNIKRVGSPKDCIKYVKKGGNFIIYGTCPFKVELSCKEKNKLLQEKSLLELVDEGQISIFKVPQLKKAIDILTNEHLEKERRYAPEVFWYYGKTGTGKTKKAVEEAQEKSTNGYWISNGSGQWYDGYKGQESVVIDDIRPNTWDFSTVLRITDRYKFQVPIKGGFIQWVPKYIWITAPARPEEVYANHTNGEPYDGIEQLIRRIGEDRIIEFPIDDPEATEISQTTQIAGYANAN